MVKELSLSYYLPITAWKRIRIHSFFEDIVAYSWYNYTYTYICGNIINNNDERTHFFRKIYLSHFIRKGWCFLCVRGELETERETTTYWPLVPLTIAARFPHSAGLLNRGSWGPQPSAWSWFLTPRASYLQLRQEFELWLQLELNSACLKLQLTQAVCGTWLYNCLSSTCFLWASHLHRIQPRPPVKVIFRYLRPDVPVSWLTARSRVNMLQH